MLKHPRVGILALALWLLLFVPCSQSASAAPQNVPESSPGSVLSDEDMLSILKSLNMPEARVLSIRTSPFNGLWEAAIENKGHRFVIYVDSSKKYVSPGPFIDYAAHKDLTRARIDELNRERRIDLSKIPLQDALIVGKTDARLKVIVFTDPGCPHCAKLHREMKKLVEKRPDIAFYLKLFALVSPDPRKVKSVACSKSLSVLEDAYNHKEVATRDCPSNDVENNTKFARESGLTAAPALIFPDGSLQLGSSSAAELEKRIDEAASGAKKE